MRTDRRMGEDVGDDGRGKCERMLGDLGGCGSGKKGVGILKILSFGRSAF